MPRGAKPHFTPAQDREIADLYRAGQSTYEIGQKYGVSPTPVTKALKRQGVPMRAAARRAYWTGTPSERAAVVTAYRDEHKSVRRVAKQFQVRMPVIAACLDEAGVSRTGGARPMFNEATTQAIVSEYQAGANMRELAQKYGSSAVTISNCLQRDGTQPRRSGRWPLFFTPERTAEAVRRAEAGETQQQIAAALGCTQSPVSSALRRAGVTAKSARGHGRMEAHPCWQGGRSVSRQGYILVKVSDDIRHLIGPLRSEYVLEHRLVMARKLGRPLTEDETVHHVDGDKTHNDPENLQLRQGNHGKGVVLACLDCGSANVGAVPLH